MVAKALQHKNGIFVILAVYLLFFMLQNDYACAQYNQLKQRRTNQERANSQGNRDRDFYRVIVENNLFRPLGWREPRHEPEYILIATWIGSSGETAKALLMERSSNQTYYAAIGEKVGNATIENIESKRVTLNIAGKILTLRIPSMQFLNTRRFLNKPSQSLHERPKQSTAHMTSVQSRQVLINRDRHGHRQVSDKNRQRWSQRLLNEFRNATPENRRKIIDAFRQ